jgi:hypothetical protein
MMAAVRASCSRSQVAAAVSSSATYMIVEVRLVSGGWHRLGTTGMTRARIESERLELEWLEYQGAVLEQRCSSRRGRTRPRQ